MVRHVLLISTAVTLVVLTACSSGPEPDDVSPAREAVGGETGDSTPVPDVQEEVAEASPAILDSPARITTTCKPLRDAVPLEASGEDRTSPGAWTFGVVAPYAEGLAYLSWNEVSVEKLGQCCQFDHSELRVAPIDLDGSAGPAVLAASVGTRVRRTWAMPSDTGVAVAYQTDEVPFSFGILSMDSSGALLTPPTAIPGLLGFEPSTFRRVGDGYAALCDDDVVRFDGSGQASEPKTRLFSARRLAVAAESPDGLAGIWVSTLPGSETTYQGLRLDAEWRPMGEAHAVELPDEYEGTGGSLVAVDDGFLLAYDVDRPADHATIVRILRLDADFAAVGPARDLQAPGDHVDCHVPLWAPTAGGLGLAWSCGHHYDACGGCIYSETLRFAYVHPDDLTLAGEPVEIHSNAGGGVFGRQVFERQGDLVIGADITWHAWSATATAIVHCEATR